MSGIILDAFRYCPPLASQFPTLIGTNSQNPTVTDTPGRGMVLDFGTSPVAGDNVRCALKAKTILTTTYSIKARILTTTMLFSHQVSGLCVSDGTKIVTFGHSGGSTGNSCPGIKITRWNSSTSFNSEPLTPPSNKVPKIFEWLRLDVVSGVPTNFFISDNGTDWIEFFSSSQAGFLTYTHVGFCSFIARTAGPEPVSGTNQQTAAIHYYSDPDIIPPV